MWWPSRPLSSKAKDRDACDSPGILGGAFREVGEVEGPDADSDSQEHPEPPAAKVPRAEDRRSKYVIVELPGAIFRLHRSGANGCWMGRRREFRNSQEFPHLPINPSTPTFVACVGLAAERGRIQLGRPPQPCREMGRR